MLTILAEFLRSERRNVNLVDLVKSFPTAIYLQNLASIQPRTSLSKFGGKFKSLFIRLLNGYGNYDRAERIKETVANVKSERSTAAANAQTSSRRRSSKRLQIICLCSRPVQLVYGLQSSCTPIALATFRIRILSWTRKLEHAGKKSSKPGVLLTQNNPLEKRKRRG